MITIQANIILSDKVLLTREEFNLLIEKAKKTEEVVVNEVNYDLTTDEIMSLEEQSGAYDFLLDKREDIYTVSDVKVPYK